TVRGRSEYKAELAGLLGGRAAEEIVFNDITTGASSDMERATKTARNMVTRWGMSDRLGPMVYGQKEELIFLGREISEQRDYSDQVANEIDEEVRKLVNDAFEVSKSLLLKYREELDRVAGKLIEVETLDEEEFNRIFPAPQPKRSGTPIPRG
ncbi:MAG: cell division protein FtsH, partial [Anaerolineales bacterium]